MHISIYKCFGMTVLDDNILNQMLATIYNEQVWIEVK